MSLFQPREYPSVVLAKDSKDNAVATALVNAVNEYQRYHITGVDASFSTSSTSGLIQLKDDATVIWEQYFSGSASFSFPSPIVGTAGKSFSAVLTASGTAGVIGKVNLRGYLV